MRTVILVLGSVVSITVFTRVLKIDQPFIPKLATQMWQATSHRHRMSIMSLALWDSLPDGTKRYFSAKSGDERATIIKQAVGGVVGTVAGFAIAAIAYVEVFGNHATRYMFHSILPILDSLSPIGDTPEIAMAKRSIMPPCPSKTVEQMVNGYMKSPRWDSGQPVDDPKLSLVNVEGYVAYAGKSVRSTLQFGLDQNALTFKALEFNGVPQPLLVTAQLFQSMCAQAGSIDVDAPAADSAAPFRSANQRTTQLAAESEIASQPDLATYLLNDFAQDARVGPILDDCQQAIRNEFAKTIALYTSEARGAATKSQQQAFLNRAAQLARAETPRLFCLVLSVDAIGAADVDAIRHFLNDLTARGVVDFRKRTDGRHVDGSTYGNIAYVISGKLFLSLAASVSKLPTDPIGVSSSSRDAMSLLYENTIVMRGPDGTEWGRRYYDADGTFRAVGGQSETLSGTWRLEGGDICTTRLASNVESPKAKCSAFKPYGSIGDIQVRTIDDGRTMTLTLEAGRP